MSKENCRLIRLKVYIYVTFLEIECSMECYFYGLFISISNHRLGPLNICNTLKGPISHKTITESIGTYLKNSSTPSKGYI